MISGTRYAGTLDAAVLTQKLTAADLLPENLRDALAKIGSAGVH